MDHIGIDVHKKESQLCIRSEGGEWVESRIRTTPERFADVLGDRPRARILLEASTESEWVARCLEGLGHEVIVADPNFAPMYAARSGKIKTDRRDARARAEACLLGAYRPAHRLSDAQRHVRGLSFAKTPSGGQVVDRSALIMPRSNRSGRRSHVSMVSIQETIPRPTVGSPSVHADQPSHGHWEGGGPPRARLTTTPVHLPVLPARAAARRALGPGQGISIPVGDPPRSP
jgi:hypothetical protein